MLKTAHTTKFEELIAFVSLYRPGPMDNIPDFVARMKGQEFNTSTRCSKASSRRPTGLWCIRNK